MIWKYVESYVEFPEKIDPMADVARTLNLLGVTFGQVNIGNNATSFNQELLFPHSPRVSQGRSYNGSIQIDPTVFQPSYNGRSLTFARDEFELQGVNSTG